MKRRGQDSTGSAERTERRRGFTTAAVAVRRQPWGTFTVVSMIALLLGVVIGQLLTPAPGAEARAAIEAQVLPVVRDADGIWTAGSEDRAAVTDALVALRSTGSSQAVIADADAWLEAYDSAILRIAGADLAALARPVQRQFLTAVTLSRDAIEVLVRAAEAEDADVRTDLVTEVGRLRARSEQLMQTALASTVDLGGGRTDLAPLPELDAFDGEGSSAGASTGSSTP